LTQCNHFGRLGFAAGDDEDEVVVVETVEVAEAAAEAKVPEVKLWFVVGSDADVLVGVGLHSKQSSSSLRLSHLQVNLNLQYSRLCSIISTRSLNISRQFPHIKISGLL